MLALIFWLSGEGGALAQEAATSGSVSAALPSWRTVLYVILGGIATQGPMVWRKYIRPLLRAQAELARVQAELARVQTEAVHQHQRVTDSPAPVVPPSLAIDQLTLFLHDIDHNERELPKFWRDYIRKEVFVAIEAIMKVEAALNDHLVEAKPHLELLQRTAYKVGTLEDNMVKILKSQEDMRGELSGFIGYMRGLRKLEPNS